MKSKLYMKILGFILFVLLLNVPYTFAQTYSWNINIGEEFIWKVDLVNQDALNTTFGVNWEDDLKEKFGDGCQNLNYQRKYKFINISSDTNNWYLDFDIWNWSNSNFGLSADILEYRLSYQKFEAHIFSGRWDSGAYFSALDVDDYLEEHDTNENSYNLNNTWIYNETDLTEYLIIYTFNINSGVLSKAEIKDDSDTVLYRFSIQTNTNGQIPFTNYFLIFTLSTIVLIGALITKKIKIKST